MRKNKIFTAMIVEAVVVIGLLFHLLIHSENTQTVMSKDACDDTQVNEVYAENIEEEKKTTTSETPEKNFIKWVDFKVSFNALDDAYKFDVESHGTEAPVHWIELLAYLGARYGGDFAHYKKEDMEKLVKQLTEKKATMEELTKEMKHYDYYYKAYEAVLGGMVGEYEAQVECSDLTAKSNWEKKYGLKSYLPIAKNFPYSDFDDFGVSRSYGYKRRHLGHDMMGQVGTPIIAVESGYVEAIGWNQYGGWRIGIRSFDKKRYYYYAHLRKNYPYNKELKEGSIVKAGDVIGYLGRTGYSATENTNNIDSPHLHFGLQLIFDESQKDGNGEIWVDCYNLVRFLYQNRCETVKIQDSKEWCRIYDIKDPVVEHYMDQNKSN